MYRNRKTNVSSYELYIINILKKNHISFIKEKTFNDLKHGIFRFDFYIPSMNIIIEVDGEQHFKPIYGRRALLKAQEHDRRKNQYCLANNIKLYRIPYWKLKSIHELKDIFNNDFLVKNYWHNDYLINT